MSTAHFRITTEAAAAIRERRAEGATLAELAKDFDTSTTTILRITRYQLHCPVALRAVTVTLARRDHARLALRAEEAGVPVPALASELLAQALQPA